MQGQRQKAVKRSSTRDPALESPGAATIQLVAFATFANEQKEKDAQRK
jgi:hypothetical protein